MAELVLVLQAGIPVARLMPDSLQHLLLLPWAVPAGEDFVVVAADTRLSQGYSIHTRDCSKVTQLTDKCVIVSCGMKADAITLHKHLKARLVHASVTSATCRSL